MDANKQHDSYKHQTNLDSQNKQYFVVNFHQQRLLIFGQSLFLVGNIPELGNWDPKKAIKLEWTQGNNWIIPLQISKQIQQIEYKFFSNETNNLNQNNILWDQGCNQIFDFRENNFELEQNPKIFNIMSFNIHYVMDNWNQRKTIIKSIFFKYQPHVIGMQELVCEQINDIKTMLPNFYYFGRSRSEQENQDEQTGIFYNKNCFYQIAGDFVWFSRKKYQADYGATFPRLLVYIILKPFSNTNLTLGIINTHLCNNSNHSRRQSSLIILQTIKQINQQFKCDQIYVTGDFNAREDDEDIQILTQNNEIVSARKNAIQSDKNITTFHGNLGKLFPVNLIIDHIFIYDKFNSQIDFHQKNEKNKSNQKSIEILSFKVIQDGVGKLLSTYPSDHYPVMATVKLLI